MKRIGKIAGKLVSVILALILTTSLAGCVDGGAKTDKLSIVTTNFAMYDLARAVCGETCDITMLLSTGSDSHDFEATLSEIAKIAESDIFLYVGGESEEWVEDIKESLGKDGEGIRYIRAMDFVETLCINEESEHHDHDHEDAHVSELDEHVWLSVDNAVAIMERVRDAVISLSEELTETVNNGYAAYKAELLEIDALFRETVEGASRRVIVVADRFPFLYLTDRYGIEHYAAFSGCSSDTEPTLSTVNEMIEAVRRENVPAVIAIEFSDRKTANAVAEETGCEILELHSAHNVTTEDFHSGVTFADIMRRNLETIRTVLGEE